MLILPVVPRLVFCRIQFKFTPAVGRQSLYSLRMGWGGAPVFLGLSRRAFSDAARAGLVWTASHFGLSDVRFPQTDSCFALGRNSTAVALSGGAWPQRHFIPFPVLLSLITELRGVMVLFTVKLLFSFRN